MRHMAVKTAVGLGKDCALRYVHVVYSYIIGEQKLNW